MLIARLFIILFLGNIIHSVEGALLRFSWILVLSVAKYTNDRNSYHAHNDTNSHTYFTSSRQARFNVWVRWFTGSSIHSGVGLEGIQCTNVQCESLCWICATRICCVGDESRFAQLSKSTKPCHFVIGLIGVVYHMNNIGNGEISSCGMANRPIYLQRGLVWLICRFKW